MNVDQAKANVRPGDVVVMDNVGPFRVVDTRDSLLGYGPLHDDEEAFTALSWSDVDEYIAREYSESIKRYVETWDYDDVQDAGTTTEPIGADDEDVQDALEEAGVE